MTSLALLEEALGVLPRIELRVFEKAHEIRVSHGLEPSLVLPAGSHLPMLPLLLLLPRLPPSASGVNTVLCLHTAGGPGRGHADVTGGYALELFHVLYPFLQT